MGHSAETIRLTLGWTDGAPQQRDVVVHVRPEPPGLLEPYDLRRQFELLRALEPTPVRSPAALWYEETGAVLGRECFVMECAAGTVYERVDTRGADRRPGARAGDVGGAGRRDRRHPRGRRRRPHVPGRRARLRRPGARPLEQRDAAGAARPTARTRAAAVRARGRATRDARATSPSCTATPSRATSPSWVRSSPPRSTGRWPPSASRCPTSPTRRSRGSCRTCSPPCRRR